MSETLLTKVQQAFQDAFHLEPGSVTLETQPDDVPQWDSLGHTTLALCLEREFNIKFDIDELMALENVREIVRVVGGKIASAD